MQPPPLRRPPPQSNLPPLSFLLWTTLLSTLLVFFLSRPGEAELLHQLNRKGQSEELLWSFFRVVPSRNPFQNLSKGPITDYVLFSTAQHPNKAEKILLGICGQWFVANKADIAFVKWSADYDILFSCLIYCASYLSFALAPRFAWRFHTPAFSRPWSLVASGFACPSIFHLLSMLYAMVEFGTEVRRRFMASSLIFWQCTIIAPVMACVAILAFDSRGSWPLGPSFAQIALAAYGALHDPTEKQRIMLLGQFPLGFFGLVFAEVSAMMISIPTSNILVGLLAAAACLTTVGVVFVINHPQFRWDSMGAAFSRYVQHLIQM